MKKKNIVFAALPAAAIIMEALPFGAVLNFSPSPGETLRETFSYFSLVPYGYANFGPLLTAILTCAVLALTAINIFADSSRLRKTAAVLSLFAFITSLMPLMFGIGYYSVIGAVISALLAAEFCIMAFAKDTKGE